MGIAHCLFSLLQTGTLTPGGARCSSSEREVERGESEIWGIVAPDTVGVLDGLGLRARYGFDYVFAGAASNAEVHPPSPCAAHGKLSQAQLCGKRTDGLTDAQVYDTTARQIVASTLDGAARPHLSQKLICKLRPLRSQACARVAATQEGNSE